MEKFILEQKQQLWLGSFPALTAAGFVHGCSGRLHGQSTVVPGTQNLALHVGDEQELVLANRRRFAQALGVDPLHFTTCEQVHGSTVAVVGPEQVGRGALALEDTIPGTDALVCNIPGVPLLLFYADCVPVLLADQRTGAVGLAHAGWRGTVAQIVKKTLAVMVQEYGTRPAEVLAGIGPSIGACCYEVDDFVRDQAPGYEEFFAPTLPGKYQLDLWGYNQRLLEEAGVPAQQVQVAGVCTNDNVQLFCSYRAEQGRTGRMGVALCAR